MNETLRVLQVEGSILDASSSEHVLAKAGYSLHCERVVNAAEMRAALAEQPWDVIISDYRLPHFDAPAALLLLRESGQDIPFIVVSAAIGEELALAIMKSGAQDYLLKDDLARLAPAVERELQDARTRRDRAIVAGALQQSEERVEAQRATLERQTVSLHQRETLLREIHHRVKNNMQVMSSLMSLQARAAMNPETRRMLEDNQNRIQSMALLHEILYQSEDLAMVDFPKYVLRTVDYLFRSIGVKDRRIGLHTKLDQLALELDDALPFGLLISEVVSNSLKHAFPQGRGGEVRVLLRQQSGHHHFADPFRRWHRTAAGSGLDHVALARLAAGARAGSTTARHARNPFAGRHRSAAYLSDPPQGLEFAARVRHSEALNIFLLSARPLPW